MIEELLRAAERQAEASAPAVRTAALLRIARVWTALSQAESERLLERGLTALAVLPEDERAAITPRVDRNSCELLTYVR